MQIDQALQKQIGLYPEKSIINGFKKLLNSESASLIAAKLGAASLLGSLSVASGMLLTNSAINTVAIPAMGLGGLVLASLSKLNLERIANNFWSLENTLASIKEYLDKGGDPNASGRKLLSAEQSTSSLILLASSEDNCINRITLLANAGADMNAVDHEGYTALHHAVASQRPHLGNITALVSNGADINMPDPMGTSPLELCAKLGLTQLHQSLLELSNAYHARKLDEKLNTAVAKRIESYLSQNLGAKIEPLLAKAQQLTQSQKQRALEKIEMTKSALDSLKSKVSEMAHQKHLEKAKEAGSRFMGKVSSIMAAASQIRKQIEVNNAATIEQQSALYDTYAKRILDNQAPLNMHFLEEALRNGLHPNSKTTISTADGSQSRSITLFEEIVLQHITRNRPTNDFAENANAWSGSEELVKTLIARGGDIHTTDPKGKTLIETVFSVNKKVGQMMLEEYNKYKAANPEIRI